MHNPDAAEFWVPSDNHSTWTRTGTAKWTGQLAENPEPPESPFGYIMPADISVDGDTMTITEGVHDPLASGGTEHDPKVIEFVRGS